jgi:DNA repair exonuclease SbcCD ATPase subunit
MPEKTEAPKWTDSKKDIWNAYKASQKELSQRARTTLDPVKVKTNKRKKEVIEKAKPLNLDGVSKSIETLKNRTEGALNGISDEIKAQLENLETIQEATRIREEEIREIYGIEKEAETLAALVDAQAKQKERFETTMAEQKENFQDEQRRAKKAWEEEKSEYLKAQKLQESEDKNRRAREMADHKYNYERDERVRLDNLQDNLKTQQKAHQEMVEQANKALNEREEAIAKKEQEYTDLQAKIDAFPAELEAAQEQAKKRASQSYGIEVNALKKGYEADIKVLQANVENLTGDKADLQRQVASLNTKLENAYSQVNQAAMAALESKGNANTVAQIQKTVEAGASSKR